MLAERLLERGLDVWIDNRSYAEQGIELEPQHKIGPAGMRRAEREGARGEAERADEHAAIARRNGEAIIERPELVLDAITRQHSTFIRQDLARFVDRHTADREQFDRAMAAAEAAPALVRLGRDGRGRDRFTTREMLEAERQMERTAGGMAGRGGHQVLAAEAARAVSAAKRGGWSWGRNSVRRSSM